MYRGAGDYADFETRDSVLLTGRWLAAWGSYTIGEVAWVTWGYALFIASGVIWAGVQILVQVKQARLARGFASDGPILDRCWRLGRIWLFWGIVATGLPLANLYWMFFKPSTG